MSDDARTDDESLRRRAGHCNGRPLDPACGYCGATRQCERCEAIAAQWPLTRDRDAARAEVDRLRAELEGLHSWVGLMSLLDEHWPADIFQADAEDGAADPGPRIVALLRWVDRLRAELARRDTADRIVTELCDEYGVEPGELVDAVNRDRSIRQAFDSLVAQRERDLRAAGDELAAAAMEQLEGVGFGPKLDRAVQAWRAVRGDAPTEFKSRAETLNSGAENSSQAESAPAAAPTDGQAPLARKPQIVEAYEELRRQGETVNSALDAVLRIWGAAPADDTAAPDETPLQFRGRMELLMERAAYACRCSNRLHWHLDGPEHRLAHALEIVAAGRSVRGTDGSAP